MERKKSIFLMALLLAMGVQAAKGEEFTTDNITYTILSSEPPTVEVKKASKNNGESVVIPETVKPFGESQKEYRVVSMGEYSLDSYGDFTTLILPKSIERIPPKLSGNSNWTETEIDEENPFLKAIDGVIYTHSLDTLITCPSGKTKFEPLPPMVKVIGERAFERSRMKTIELSEELTEICEYAFFESEIESLVIPSSVKTIGASAFAMSKLKEISLQEGLVSIGNEAFFCATRLQNVIFPSTVEYYGHSLLGECYSLRDVVFPETMKEIPEYSFMQSGSPSGEIHIPNSVTTIGRDAFYRWRGSSITIPSSVVSIYENPFGGCSFEMNQGNEIFFFENGMLINRAEMELVAACGSKIPDGVKSISPYALKEFRRSSLAFPKSMKSIDAHLINSNCSNLKTIYVYSETPPKLNDTFRIMLEGEFAEGPYFITPKIYVPDRSLEKYKYEAENWKSMKEYIYPMDWSEGVTGIDSPFETDESEVYRVITLEGRVVMDGVPKESLNSLDKGLYIINGKKTLIK